MIRHYAELMQPDDRIFVGKMEDRFCYDLTEFGFFYPGAAEIARSHSGITFDRSKVLAGFYLLYDDMIDKWGIIIMGERASVEGMFTGLTERTYL